MRLYVRFPKDAYPNGELIPGDYEMADEPFCRLLTPDQINFIRDLDPKYKDIYTWIDSEKTWKRRFK